MDTVTRGSGLYIPLARRALQSLNLPLPRPSEAMSRPRFRLGCGLPLAAV